MNTYYNTVEVIKKRLKANPLVNTVIYAKTEEKDLYKKTIFPVAHIVPVPSVWKNNQVNRFSFEVGVFEQRDIVKEPTTTRFEGNDNQIDNMNTTYQVINDLLSYLEMEVNEHNVRLISVGNITPLTFKDVNLLDGWSVIFTVDIDNVIDLCDVE